MIIAADTRGSDNFIYELLKKIAAQQTQHNFIFFTDESDNSILSSKNITAIKIKPQKIYLLEKISISSLLKKNNADVFITANAVATNIPQVIMATDRLKASAYKKAKKIIADSEFFKSKILADDKIAEDKVDVIYKWKNEKAEEIEFTEREKIKQQFADGNEFFLSAGNATSEDLLTLLKAFSAFKKMQKSNMQLVIASGAKPGSDFLEKLRHFKYSSEVKLLDNAIDVFPMVMNSCYAFIQSFFDKKYSLLINAIQSKVPVIANQNFLSNEILGDAALFANDDTKAIAGSMMLIYKDEKIRSELIEKGNLLVKKYSCNAATERLWNTIGKAVH